MDYLIRRLLLMIPTFIGVTLIIFAILAYVPGGPVEQEIMNLRGVGGGEGGGGKARDTEVTPEMVYKIKKKYGLHHPWYIQYGKWLQGLFPMRFSESLFSLDLNTEMAQEKIPEALHLKFAKSQIRLSETAQVHSHGNGTWSIHDSKEEQNFFLYKDIESLLALFLLPVKAQGVLPSTLGLAKDIQGKTLSESVKAALLAQKCKLSNSVEWIEGGEDGKRFFLHDKQEQRVYGLVRQSDAPESAFNLFILDEMIDKLNTRYQKSLDQKKLTSDLKERLRLSKTVLSSESSIEILKADQLWQMSDPLSKKNYMVLQIEEGEIKVLRKKIQFCPPDLGMSWKYGEPVWNRIGSRVKISVVLGLLGFAISYLVCIPLGVLKALKHNTPLDVWTSIAIFMGYAIPGWVLGTVLLVFLGGGTFDFKLFPLRDYYPDDWKSRTNWGLFLGYLYHCTLPILCYMAGMFASTTILMKNSLMENLSQDYVRTAFAKGLPERRVIFVHALRNSMIPLATGLGHALSWITAGSFLIENVFNIDGMGRLSYTSIVERDYPVAIGIIVINAVLLMIGNILADFLLILFDPRIKLK
jgi:microcin C transport system permease protein